MEVRSVMRLLETRCEENEDRLHEKKDLTMFRNARFMSEVVASFSLH